MRMLKKIAEHVRSKRELSNVSLRFIEFLIPRYFSQEMLNAEDFRLLQRKKEYRSSFKEIRAVLRKIFWQNTPVKYAPGTDMLQILLSNPSTKERYYSYAIVADRIKSLNPSAILDMGCGLNPLLLAPLLNCAYNCCDIVDNSFINDFFKAKGVSGSFFYFNMLDRESYRELPSADVCLIFKTLDSLEIIERNITAKILPQIPCKTLIVSFTKVSASGKQRIKTAVRSWFLRVVRRLSYSCETFETDNEVFYIVRK